MKDHCRTERRPITPIRLASKLSNSPLALARVYLLHCHHHARCFLSLTERQPQPPSLSTCCERETSLSSSKLDVAPNTLIRVFLA